MASYLLDTEVCLRLLRGNASAKHLPEIADCRISAVSVAELQTGVARSQTPEASRHRLEILLDLFAIVPFDAAAGEEYGDIRAGLERSSQSIGPMDLLIAAHARSLGATLITANPKEFQRVPRLVCLAWD